MEPLAYTDSQSQKNSEHKQAHNYNISSPQKNNFSTASQTQFSSTKQLPQNLNQNTCSQKTRTIDVPVETLFTKYNKENQGILTRLEIAEILTQIFRSFNINNPVTKDDVDNFLLDYDIKHKGDLRPQDFEGISKLRFILRELPINNNPVPAIKIMMPPPQPQIRQIVVPVRMLFDIFNRRHDGHLTRQEIGEVINLIFKDFSMPYEVNELDVQNFLQDFDINHDRQITLQDFKGIDVLHFDIHHENQMRVY